MTPSTPSVPLQTVEHHAPVTTLAELDALDENDLLAGYCSTRRGDPEPGANHTRSYHHGWRMRMMDFGEIETTPDHRELVHLYMERERLARIAASGATA